MLVLSRKTQEQIIIDQRIEITVLAVRGNRVRLGISAPADVSILRGELDRDLRDGAMFARATDMPESADADSGTSSVLANIREDCP
jgi:carbon storage regulator